MACVIIYFPIIQWFYQSAFSIEINNKTVASLGKIWVGNLPLGDYIGSGIQLLGSYGKKRRKERI